MPHVYPNPPKRNRGNHGGGLNGLGGSHRKQGCCSYQEAGRALMKGRTRLAWRFIRLDLKTRLGVI